MMRRLKLPPYEPPDPYWTIGVVPSSPYGDFKLIQLRASDMPELTAKGHWSLRVPPRRFASYGEAAGYIDARTRRWDADEISPFVFYNVHSARNRHYKLACTADDPTPDCPDWPGG